MTAIVGVLNKHAIAVAADSAETVGEGLKIYDKANKIFTLSKHHPIGIAVYNNADFNSIIPWEIIIKMYRRQLEDRPLDTVEEYAADFFRFLADFQSSYIAKDVLDSVACGEVLGFWQTEIINMLHSSQLGAAGIDSTDLPELESLLLSYKGRAQKTSKVPSLAKVGFNSFVACIGSALQQIASNITAIGGGKELCDHLIPETLYEIFTRDCFHSPTHSGLAFFGYGEHEIYPTLYETLVFSSIAGNVNWRGNVLRRISDQGHTAFIHPMAQTDVMQTYIEGISPQIEETFMKITEATMGDFLKNIAGTLKSNRPLATAISNIDLTPFMSHFQASIAQFKRDATIGPLMSTVATMEKEDLAELAENLIYLTSLKRRITPNLESVGGPVDVAIVSKGDGFIWLKRKHYFDPELNRVYFDKYFKS